MMAKVNWRACSVCDASLLSSSEQKNKRTAMGKLLNQYGMAKERSRRHCRTALGRMKRVMHDEVVHKNAHSPAP